MSAKLIYGTAWKGERTAELVEKAVLCGFRAIDTACQPKHYNEAGVGEALHNLAVKHGIPRSQIFVQTKFTPISGQDERVPYDPKAPVEEQVKQSFATSQRNLRTDYVDSLVLHSPFRSYASTLQAWRAMEGIHASGGAKQLGISNIYDLEYLKRLFMDSIVKPSVVQNRFYAETGYDVDLRAWCASQGIRYQSFWTLTANPHILQHPWLVRLSEKLKKTPEQLLFKYLTERNVDPLTGTKDIRHMKEDLSIFTFTIDESALEEIDKIIRQFA